MCMQSKGEAYETVNVFFIFALEKNDFFVICAYRYLKCEIFSSTLAFKCSSFQRIFFSFSKVKNKFDILFAFLIQIKVR